MLQPDNSSISLPQRIQFYVLILASAIFIIFPTVQKLFWAKPVVGLMLISLAIPMVYKGMKLGTYASSLGGIYSQAKSGRRFRSSPLESAAFVAVNIAFWMTI